MNQGISKSLNVIQILTGLIMIGSIFIWAPVCEGLLELVNGKMVHMKCYYTGQATLQLSIIIIVASIESLITKKNRPWTIIIIGILMIINTFTSIIGIGVCMNETMSCQITKLWIRGGGIVTIICGLISLFSGQRQVKEI